MIGVENFRSWPAMTTFNGGSETVAAATARSRYARSRCAARSMVNPAAAADVRAAASRNRSGSVATAAAASATSSSDAANSG
jgi:hypothetical protein